jgi:hypothetical protein
MTWQGRVGPGAFQCPTTTAMMVVVVVVMMGGGGI